MNKNYGWCSCCGEPTCHTELSSTVTGYCVSCEDYMKAVNPCMGCGRDFPNVMLSDNVGGCCLDCTLMEGSDTITVYIEAEPDYGGPYI